MKLEKSCRREINDMARGVGHDDDGDDVIIIIIIIYLLLLLLL